MTDIFISYASEDRERALTLANALEGCGWSVWWDRKIIAGQTFDQVIERELETARSVVVLWSKDSILSEWVKNEAAVAAERGVLIPALIENVKLPLEFRRKQTADLIGWDGNPSHSGFRAVCEGIATALESPAPRKLPATSAGSTFRNRRWTIGVIGGMAILVVLVAYTTGLWPTSPATSVRDAPGIALPDVSATSQPKALPDLPTASDVKQGTAADVRTATVKDRDGFVNVRSGPGTNFPIIGHVNSGQTVQLRELNGAWWLVDAPIGSGYIHQSRLAPGK